MKDKEVSNEELFASFENDGNQEGEGLTWSSKRGAPDDTKLVEWPYSQRYMDEPWFLNECYLDTSGRFGDCTYHIPVSRIKEVQERQGEEAICEKPVPIQ